METTLTLGESSEDVLENVCFMVLTIKKRRANTKIGATVKEAMEYKLERLNTTLIRSIYNTPIYNRLMYCPRTRLTTNLRATSKEVT